MSNPNTSRTAPLINEIGASWTYPPEIEQPDLGRPEYLRPKKTVRLAVSGDVMLTETELSIIDTKDFQRLRGIKQLGTVSYVYPTALHTRFDHSLGVLCMLAQMISAIRYNAHSEPLQRQISYEQEAIARLYALLHDITHIPFGHTIEDELQILRRHDENDARIRAFLGEESDIGKLIINKFGASGHKRLLQIYSWEEGNQIDIDPEDAFIHDLVSNTVCADLLDYVLRDNYFCNLNIEMEYRFLNYLFLKEYNGNKRVFLRVRKTDTSKIRRDVLSDLSRLLDARYLIAERVYFHHAKIAAGVMVGRALFEMLSAQEITEPELWQLSDIALIDRFAASENMIARLLGQQLQTRSLFKRCGEISMTTFEQAGRTYNHDFYTDAQNLLQKGDSRTALEN
jgi:HD superfamily phosphohydrolase